MVIYLLKMVIYLLKMVIYLLKMVIYVCTHNIFWLIVQFAHLEKWWSESQWGWDDIPYMKWNIKFHGLNHQPVIVIS